MYSFFPKCPLLTLTGLKCPGCGSQRAIYQLLNGNLAAAYAFNPLLVWSLPYLFLVLLLKIVPIPTERKIYFENILKGTTATWIILLIVIVYAIFRNIK